MTETQIERVLRNAPKIRAPRELLATLKAQISLERRVTQSPEDTKLPWWKLSLPRLSFAAVVLLAVLVLGVQGRQLQKLRHQNQAFRQIAGSFQVPAPVTSADDREILAKRKDELRSLQAEVQSLRQEVALLPELRRQRDELRAQLSAAIATPNPEDPFAAEKAKAERVACMSHIKQICLAAALWAHDNKRIFPPDLLTMANKMNSPKILTCPSDTANLPAPSSWETLDPGKVSYEWLAAGHDNRDSDEVIARCRIHANYGLSDGSVHQLNPAGVEFYTENGRLKFRAKPSVE